MADGVFEVFVRQLQVVLLRNRLAVSDPSGYDIRRMIRDEFRRPSAAEILEQLRPGLNSRTENDLSKRRSEILSGMTVSDDHPLLAKGRGQPRSHITRL